MRNLQQSLFSLALLPVVVTSGGNRDWGLEGMREISQFPVPRQIIAQNTFIGSIASFWGRTPKRRLVSRSGVCAISPGLVETYYVWSDRPLFLWYSSGENKTAQLIVRDPATEEVVWMQTVNLTDQKVFYSGEKALEAGKPYQWELLASGNSIVTPRSTFQIMADGDRNKIQTDLQTLEQKLKVNKASPEEIALQKADYFVNYKITHKTEEGIFHLWSDALEILYKVDKPSPSFITKRQEKVEDLCKQPNPTP
ncbi:hypothetical protein [Nostoc sp. NMS8]|uniref:hypothetical protein n=1 Tax=Nostoc sp. NMS8 TaxID=2815392 RepID=UPI0025D96403|nr:hypothetical protein [Nostoc sp. NMS8]MBN3958724.1 DUF928 domain-containing protein [Nostoc sp. NMS8]